MAQTRTGATIDDLYRVQGKAASQPKVVRGEVADAESALPGWSMPVDDLFMGSRRP